MISTGIQTTLTAIIANTYLALGDENIAAPFCIHKENGKPIYLKAGLCGYEYAVEILVDALTPEVVETKVQAIKTAIEALAGTTLSSTVYESVTFESEEPDYDTESKMYTNILSFTINTANR